MKYLCGIKKGMFIVVLFNSYSLFTMFNTTNSLVNTIAEYFPSTIPSTEINIHADDSSYLHKTIRGCYNYTSPDLHKLKLGITDRNQQKDPNYAKKIEFERKRSQDGYNAAGRFANNPHNIKLENDIINRCNDRTQKAALFITNASNAINTHEEAFQSYKELIQQNFPALSLWILRAALNGLRQSEMNIIKTVSPTRIKEATLTIQAIFYLDKLEETLQQIDPIGPVQFFEPEKKEKINQYRFENENENDEKKIDSDVDDYA